MSNQAPSDATSDASTRDGATVPFETMLASLKTLVDGLERGDQTLEDALFAYEQGVGLVRQAQARLDDMEHRLLKLTESGTLEELK